MLLEKVEWDPMFENVCVVMEYVDSAFDI